VVFEIDVDVDVDQTNGAELSSWAELSSDDSLVAFEIDFDFDQTNGAERRRLHLSLVVFEIDVDFDQTNGAKLSSWAEQLSWAELRR
jgi:hypothetical protein